MTDPDATAPKGGATFLILAGILVTIASVIGTLVVVDDLDGAAASAKWLAGLTGLTAGGVGLLIVAGGLVLQRLDDR